ncbi:MAG: carnitine dehydratase [Rhodobacteraceae bacterium]|nr:MAG: carnitine dehydratase [Paracoccaceae bacterium]
MTQTRARPLDGILVIALEQAVAAPFTSSRLADAGARVIKVERPGGGDFARRYDSAVDGESAYFVWLNRGKESVELDIKDPAGRNLLEAMLAQADVFLQNLAPGALQKLGLDSASLRQRFPRLITCDITGYGADGPMKDAKAYDLLVQCESGLASITGTADAPGRVGVSVCDIATGMTAHAAICEALVERAQTGKGRGVSVAMFDTMADWMTAPLLFQEYLDRPTPRVGLSHPVISPYGAYRCGDGEQIVVAAQTDAEWRRFCSAVLRQGDLADDPRFHTNQLRADNRHELDLIIETAFAAFNRTEMADILDRAGIARGAVNDVTALSKHPQLDRVAVGTPSGQVNLPAPPIRRSDETPGLGPSPEYGAHTKAALQEFTGQDTATPKEPT